MNAKQKAAVIERAEGRCEYCKSLQKYSPQPFVIDHIIPRAKDGEDGLDNLALACGGCNGHKYVKTTGLDPITGKEVPLFHPREDIWAEHFTWNAQFTYMIGMSPSGRATVNTLKLNRPELVNLREITQLTGEHPP